MAHERSDPVCSGPVRRVFERVGRAISLHVFAHSAVSVPGDIKTLVIQPFEVLVNTFRNVLVSAFPAFQ